MKTIISIRREIRRVEKLITDRKEELSKLYNVRGVSEQRVSLKSDIEDLKVYRDELYNELYDHRRTLRKVLLWIGHLIWIGVIITGIICTVKYSYYKGMFVYTETHDLISTVKGNVPLVEKDLYNYLFTLSTVGTLGILIGFVGEVVHVVVHIFTSDY